MDVSYLIDLIYLNLGVSTQKLLYEASVIVYVILDERLSTSLYFI